MNFDHAYANFGIMFISPKLSKKEHNRIASKIRKFDHKIGKIIKKYEDTFYKELEKIGYENNMGVIQTKS